MRIEASDTGIRFNFYKITTRDIKFFGRCSNRGEKLGSNSPYSKLMTTYLELKLSL